MNIYAKFGEQDTIRKKGLSLGPLPVIAFDQDKGFEYGALLNIFDFGNGSNYPNLRQQWYIEISRYTKGNQQYIFWYDTKQVIPGYRLSAAGNISLDNGFDFYGYNGYNSSYSSDSISAFYRLKRTLYYFKADLSKHFLNDNLSWEIGYHFNKYDISKIDLNKYNKGKEDAEKYYGETLYEKYKKWGIIPEDEADGGISSAARIGLMYDTRDFEAAPSRGIWAEGHIILAPGFLGTTHPYYRYSLTLRQYFPILKKDLVFAYRLNYQGTFGNYSPFYALSTFSCMGLSYDREGIGGYRSVRGILRNRVQALDEAFYNAEFRWKFTRFALLKQNVTLGLNFFSDGALCTRKYDMSYRGADDAAIKQEYDNYINTTDRERLHISAGTGFRVIINENFIIAFDYAKPFNKQDGKSSFYINTGYLF